VSVASITDLSSRRPQPELVGEEREEWSLPPGAKTMDAFAFGEMDRTIKRLVSRVEILERRLSVLAQRSPTH
jgi:hypothetical protein